MQAGAAIIAVRRDAHHGNTVLFGNIKGSKENAGNGGFEHQFTKPESHATRTSGLKAAKPSRSLPSKYQHHELGRQYRFGKKLGEGTFSVVLSASCRNTEEKVAVKFLKSAAELEFLRKGQNVTYKEVIEMFLREFETLTDIGSHPNILSIYSKGQWFMVMEPAKVDLYAVRQTSGNALPLNLIIRWTEHILTGVSYVHKMGYVHQDLKSSNILIFENRTAKICDFGLARKAQKCMLVDRKLGTLWYRAPELLMGAKTYTTRIDEWSIGCVILELLLGEVAFMGNSECVCDCQLASHVNYNSDQLKRIFATVGTPTDPKDLLEMTCVKHFMDWPQIDASLASIVQHALEASEARVHHCDNQPDTALATVRRDWVELLRGLLQLHPSKRLPCDAALALPLFKALPASPQLPSPTSSLEPEAARPRGAEGSHAVQKEQGGQVSGSAGQDLFSRTTSEEVLKRASSANSDAGRSAERTLEPPLLDARFALDNVGRLPSADIDSGLSIGPISVMERPPRSTLIYSRFRNSELS